MISSSEETEIITKLSSLDIDDLQIDASCIKLGEYFCYGGFSSMYKGTYKEKYGNEVLCIKVMNVKLSEKRKIENVKREIQMLKLLKDNPAIIKLLAYSTGIIQNTVKYKLVFPYYETCLYSLIDFHLSELKIKKYVRQLLVLLKDLHSKDIIHADIKPENIMLDENDSVVVIDLGATSFKDDEESLRQTSGTLDYLSPERARNYYNLQFKTEKFNTENETTDEVFDQSSDIWTIGVLVFELLSKGYTPFTHDSETNNDNSKENLKEILNNIMNIKYILPNNFSDDAKKFIQSIFILDKKRRPTAEELLKSSWLKRNGD